MEFFNNKNIKFNTITTKAATERAAKESLRAGKVFNVNLSDISFFVQKNKEISLAIAIVVGVLVFLNNFVTEKTSFISTLDQQIQSYTEKENPLKNWQKIEKENKNFFQDFPAPISESFFIEELSLLASRHNITISQYVPVGMVEEGFYKKISVRLDCEAKSFKDVLMLLYDIEHSMFSMRVDDLKMMLKQDDFSDKEGVLSIKILTSSVQLKEKDDKKNLSK